MSQILFIVAIVLVGLPYLAEVVRAEEQLAQHRVYLPLIVQQSAELDWFGCWIEPWDCGK